MGTVGAFRRLDRRLLGSCAYGVLSSLAVLPLLSGAAGAQHKTVVIGGAPEPQGTLIISGSQAPRWTGDRGAVPASNPSVIVDLSAIENPFSGGAGARQLRIPNAPRRMADRVIALRPPRSAEPTQLAQSPVRLRPPRSGAPAAHTVQPPPLSVARAPARRPEMPTVIVQSAPRGRTMAPPVSIAAAPARPSWRRIEGPLDAPASPLVALRPSAKPAAPATVAETRRPAPVDRDIPEADPEARLVALAPASRSPEAIADPAPAEAPAPEPRRAPRPKIYWTTPPFLPAPTPPPPQTIAEAIPPADRVVASPRPTRPAPTTVASPSPPPPRPRIYWSTPPETSVPAPPRAEPALAHDWTPGIPPAEPPEPVRVASRPELPVADGPASSTPAMAAETLPPPRPMPPQPADPAAAPVGSIRAEMLAAARRMEAAWQSARAEREARAAVSPASDSVTTPRPEPRVEPAPVVPPETLADAAARPAAAAPAIAFEPTPAPARPEERRPPAAQRAARADMPLPELPAERGGGAWPDDVTPRPGAGDADAMRDLRPAAPDTSSLASLPALEPEAGATGVGTERLEPPPPRPAPARRATRTEPDRGGLVAQAAAAPRRGELLVAALAPDVPLPPPQRPRSAVGTAEPRAAEAHGGGPSAFVVRAAETELAALPPEDSVDLSIPFDTGRTDLSESQIRQMAPLLQQLRDDPALRVQIIAFADVSGESGSAARRLSLSRALAMRSYLIEQGIRSTRIDVRALGNRTERHPTDRVDLVVATP